MARKPQFRFRVLAVEKLELFQPAIEPFSLPVMLAKLVVIPVDDRPAKGWCEGKDPIIGGRRGIPGYALVDPRAQERDLLSGERVPFARWRHFHILFQTGDVINQRAFGAIARNDVHAVLAALERGRAIVEPESAFGFLRAVAPEAGSIEDGLDVSGEINCLLSRGRKFGFV